MAKWEWHCPSCATVLRSTSDSDIGSKCAACAEADQLAKAVPAGKQPKS
jgi:hypothetical protein